MKLKKLGGNNWCLLRVADTFHTLTIDGKATLRKVVNVCKGDATQRVTALKRSDFVGLYVTRLLCRRNAT